jgi:hypothetical protein
LLVQTTGRYDLVTDAEGGDYTDAGLAAWYINTAQHSLDDQLRHHKGICRLWKTLRASEGMVTFRLARNVKRVYRLTDSGLIEPVEWWTLNCGLAPQHQEYSASELPSDIGDFTVYGTHWPTRAIWVKPVSDSDREICVEAEWYTTELSAYADKSFWTMQYPDVLVREAAKELEVDMRSRTGRRDFEEYIVSRLKRIQDNYDAEAAAGSAAHWVMRS